MNTLRRSLLLLSLTGAAFGQGAQPPKYTAATLPPASSLPTYLVEVIDGSSAVDCSIGGGSFNVLCISQGGVWTPVASSGASGIISVNSQTGPAVNLQSADASIAITTPSTNVINLQTRNSGTSQCFLGSGGLVGAYTDGSGVIAAGQLLCIGVGPISFTVPTGATQLQLGINDNKFVDDTGSFSTHVSKNGGAATSVTVLGTSMPWSSTSNPSYSYGLNDGTSPTVALTGLVAGDIVTITYVSGTVNVNPGTAPNVNANGWLTTPPGAACQGGPTGQFLCGGFGKAPTYYMSLANSASVVLSINGASGAFTFSGSGVSCSSTTCTFAGGSSISLTTTGTSGAATLGGGVLNIPQYQGQIALTTTGTSGAATLIGNTLNIPQYAFTGVTSINSATGAFIFSGGGVSCSGTACTFPGAGTIPSTTQMLAGDGAGNAVATHCDDGTTTAGTVTCTEPIAITGTTHGLTIAAGTAVAGAATKVIYASDATNGYAEVNENNTGLSRVCTAANGICSGPITWPTSGDIVVSNGTTSPAGIAEVDGDCVKGVSGSWAAAACSSVANTTITVGTSAISANSCNSVTTTTMTGLTTSMTVNFTPTTDISAVTGWSPASAGQLYFTAWPSSANTLSWYVCNPTGSLITPGSSTTWNVSAK